jgi:predicted GNAT family N-acyltransferase
VTASNPPEYSIEPLGPHHNRAAFSCGLDEMDAYIQRQARQDMERNLAAVFVLTRDGKTIDGFYTLSAHSILAADLPESLGQKLPRFPLPVTLLGRMAVREALRGQGLGEWILMHALERALIASRQVASWAVVVDAKENSRAFYLKYEFLPLPSRPNRLFLPMKTIKKLFG